MKQDYIRLFDEYTHGTMPRREFLKRLSVLAGSAAAANAMLPLLEGKEVMAQQVAEDHTDIVTADESFAGVEGRFLLYTARPKGEGPFPTVVVIHQNRGLTPHIKDVARQMALFGFLAVAPDALSPMGGAPADQDKGRLMMRELDRAKTMEDFISAVSYAKNHEFSNGKVGCMGFCWGGSMSGQLSFRAPDLDAAVVYYGGPPATEDVGKIRVPLLLHYAGLDERINARVPDFEAALNVHGKSYQTYMYEGANHAFNDSSRPARYDEKSSKLAYERTVSFLKKHLS